MSLEVVWSARNYINSWIVVLWIFISTQLLLFLENLIDEKVINQGRNGKWKSTFQSLYFSPSLLLKLSGYLRYSKEFKVLKCILIFKVLKCILSTQMYFNVLKCILKYSNVFQGTQMYFQVIKGTLSFSGAQMYFQVIQSTLGYFEGLQGTSWCFKVLKSSKRFAESWKPKSMLIIVPALVFLRYFVNIQTSFTARSPISKSNSCEAHGR